MTNPPMSSRSNGLLPARASSVAGLLALLAIAGCDTAHAAGSADGGVDYPAVTILTKTSSGQGVLFKNPDATPNCLVLTSFHVARAGDDIRLLGTRRASDKPTRFEAKAGVKEVFADSQLLVLRPDTDLVDCPPLRVGDINAALRSDGIARTRRFNEATGETIFSRIVLESATSDKFSAASIGARRVEPGFSGGLITQDGRPLGIVQKVDDRGLVVASRLDYSRVFIDKYASIPELPPRSAWDATSLPPEYQAVFKGAIAIRRDAEAAQRIARLNALEANDAQLRARAGSPNHAELEDSNGVYRGQIDARGRPIGAGIRTISKGITAGNQLAGRWKETAPNTSSLLGYGVLTFERNAANASEHQNFEGEVSGAEYAGAGVLTKFNGDLWYSRWNRGNLNEFVQLFRASDGALFTARAKDGAVDGPGVLWTKDGQILAVGIWKNGNLVEDRTAALTKPK